MGRLLVRGRDTREFEIHESALPFWQGLVEVISEIPEPGDQPEPAPAGPVADPEDGKPGKSARPPKPLAAE